MSTYQRAPIEVKDLAAEILREFESHQPLIAAKVNVDFIFAYSATDDAGNKIGNAITHHGCKADGLCKILSLKDRAMGRGDAEILIDADWWPNQDIEEQRALLDHELHHISVCADKSGRVKTDDIGRPKLRMRKHDVEFGWFNVIAARHGTHSGERRQAKQIADEFGQFYWPGMFGLRDPSTPDQLIKAVDSHISGRTVTISTNGKDAVTVPLKDLPTLTEKTVERLRRKGFTTVAASERKDA